MFPGIAFVSEGLPSGPIDSLNFRANIVPGRHEMQVGSLVR